MAHLEGSVTVQVSSAMRTLSRSSKRAVIAIDMGKLASLDRKTPLFLGNSDVADFMDVYLMMDAKKLRKCCTGKKLGIVSVSTGLTMGRSTATTMLATMTCCAAFFGAYSKNVPCDMVLGILSQDISENELVRSLSCDGDTKVIYDESGVFGRKPLLSPTVLRHGDTFGSTSYSGAVPHAMAWQMLLEYYVEAVSEATRVFELEGVPAAFSTMEEVLFFGENPIRNAIAYNLDLEKGTNELYSMFSPLVKMEEAFSVDLPREHKQLISEIKDVNAAKGIWGKSLHEAYKTPLGNKRSLLDMLKDETANIYCLADKTMEIGRRLGIDSSIKAYRAGVPYADVIR